MPDLCIRCGHPFDPHVLVATTGEAMQGGIIVCPAAGCRCWSTWAPEGVPPDAVRVPSMEEVLAIRADIQGTGV